MSIPIPALPDIHPQVIPAQPDQGSLFLQGLMQALDARQKATDEQGRNSRSSQEHEVQLAQLDLAKQQMALKIAEQKRIQSETEQAGQFWQRVLDPSGQIMSGGGAPAVMQKLGITASDAGSGGPTVEGQTPPAVGTPIAGAPTVPMVGPMQRFGAAMQGLAPDVAAKIGNSPLVAAVEKQQSDFEKQKANAEALAAVEKFVATKPKDQQDDFRQLMLSKTLQDADFDTKRMALPSLYGSMNDPKAVDAALNGWRSGYETWGYWKHKLGIVGTPSTIDNETYLNPQQRTDKAEQGRYVQQTAQFLSELAGGAKIINALADDPKTGLTTGGISFLGQIKKDMMAHQDEGWSNTGLIGVVKKAVVNGTISDQQSQLVTSMFDVAYAWAHLTSGARITNQQMDRILGNLTYEINDKPATKQLKKNMLSTMIVGASDIAKGIRTEVDVLQGMLKQNWSPEIRASLEAQLKDAVQYRKERLAGRAAPVLSTDAPDSPDAATDQMESLTAALDKALGRKP